MSKEITGVRGRVSDAGTLIIKQMLENLGLTLEQFLSELNITIEDFGLSQESDIDSFLNEKWMRGKFISGATGDFEGRNRGDLVNGSIIKDVVYVRESNGRRQIVMRYKKES